MVGFRKIGKGIGTVGGTVIGGTVKVAGKAVSNKWKGTGEWLEEVGESVQKVSKNSLENAGQFIDGVLQSSYGAIKKDEQFKQKGFHDVKESTSKTVKGIGSAINYTFKNINTTYKGIKKGDKIQTIDGLKNLGKVVVVSSLAIGIVDIIDGIDSVEAVELDTINDHLNGYEHPETGVLFVERTIDLPDGQTVEGTFPVFDSSFNVLLSEDLYLESDAVQFHVANSTLYDAIMEDPSLANDLGFSQGDMEMLASGQTPEGFTWHHHEQPGVLQLVDEETHNQTAHTGGRALWGGGSEYR